RLQVEGGDVIDCDRVVLACPAWHAAPIVRACDAELADALNGIPSAPVAVVAAGWNERDVAPVRRGFGFLVPGRERLGVLGTLFDSWIFPNRAPAGRALWRTLLGGARDRGAIDLDDGALVDRALRSYDRLLGLRVSPT